MPDTAPALPEWISPPGEIVARILEDREISLDDFAARVELSTREARGFVEGTRAVDEDLATRLADVVGASTSFWLRCERSYREDRDRNFASYVDDEVKDWLKRLPLKDMSNLGWIKRYRSQIKQAEECFRFFGIMGLDDWKEEQTRLLSGVNFRTSTAFSSDIGATSAWLRWAEGKAEDMACEPWDREAFAVSLDAIRGLTRNHHPERFVPRLRDLFAAAGVALVIAPAPGGCRASGATKLIRESKAMIVLSFRFFSDDHFWFTLFHEAAHLVRHGDQELFLEEDGGELDNKEREANAFALETLIPPERQDAMRALPQEHEAYVRFARDLGIAPGIVVGQMQRLGHLPYSWLNRLKRRFAWKALYQRGVIP